MSKTKEQSAIDIIYSLLDKVDLLDKKIDIIHSQRRKLLIRTLKSHQQSTERDISLAIILSAHPHTPYL